MDGVEDILFVLDADRRFTFVNAFALRTWNRELIDLLGQPLEDGRPVPLSLETLEIFQRAVRTQRRCEFESVEFTAAAAASVVLSPHLGGLVIHCRRLTSSTVGLPDAAFAPSGVQPHPFVAFARQLEQLQNSNDIVRHTLAYLLTQTTFDQAVYVEWASQSVSLSQQVVRPDRASPEVIPDIQLLLSRLVPEMQFTRQTVQHTAGPLVNRVLQAFDPQIRIALLIPVFQKEQVVAGILLLTTRDEHATTALMQGIGELTALHLEYALRFCQRADEDRSALNSNVLALGVALEARDVETHRHTQRTARMAVEFGQQLGFQGSKLEHLWQSAYLHDLGKLCIPDAILQCSGRLTPEEWRMMQTHTTSGWALADQIPGLAPVVLDVIRHHHEHWDGSGYPDGLAGSAIPLLARVVAVCDVYDALISERPYKNAWTVEATCQEIQAQSGYFFDPEIVQAFLTFLHLHSS